MNRLSKVVGLVVALGAAWGAGWVSCFAMGLVANKKFQPRLTGEVRALVMEMERGVVDADSQ